MGDYLCIPDLGKTEYKTVTMIFQRVKEGERSIFMYSFWKYVNKQIYSLRFKIFVLVLLWSLFSMIHGNH